MTWQVTREISSFNLKLEILRVAGPPATPAGGPPGPGHVTSDSDSAWHPASASESARLGPACQSRCPPSDSPGLGSEPRPRREARAPSPSQPKARAASESEPSRRHGQVAHRPGCGTFTGSWYQRRVWTRAAPNQQPGRMSAAAAAAAAAAGGGPGRPTRSPIHPGLCATVTSGRGSS